MNIVLKQLKILEKKFIFFFSGIIFKFVLEYTYIYFVNVNYNYLGFNLDISFIKYLEGWVIYLLFLLFTPHIIKKISDFIINIILFSFLSPLLVFYSLSNAVRTHLYLVLIGISIIYLFRNGKKFKLSGLKHGHVYAFFICILGSVFVSSWLILSGGFNFFNLDFDRVYEFRRAVGEVINIGLMGYLNSWTFKVFGPFLLIFFLHLRKYFFSSLIFLVHLFWFGVSSAKSVLFYPFLIIFIYIFYKNNKGSSIIPIGFALGVLISYIFFFNFDLSEPSNLFIRRVFFIPSLITFNYYEFFSQEQFIFWSDSITSKFIEYPFDLYPPKLIGREYFGNEDTNANNSFFSTGYMHAGIIGVIIYSIIFSLILRLLDSLSYNQKHIWISIAIIIIPIRSAITDSDLPVSLLTKGILIALLLLYLSKNYFNK